MRQLQFKGLTRRGGINILCLGAHCDDIDLGCGASLLALLEGTPNSSVTWVTFSGSAVRRRELNASARQFLKSALHSRVISFEHRDGYFPSQHSEIKDQFESLKKLPSPDLIFTHQREDFHQDHRVVAELTWNTFRNHLILEYEIPKYEGGLTTPSVYVEVTKLQVERKISLLLKHYVSQRAKPWFTADTFRALMRLRGIESGAVSGWAEGFHARKILF